MMGIVRNKFAVVCGGAVLTVAGCAAPPPPAATQPAAAVDNFRQAYRPYIPASQPAVPVTEQLPKSPRDAQPAVALRYTVEIWEILMPRDSVTTNEAFWKRVNEQALDLPTYDLLFKNGIRVGEMPLTDVDTIRQLIEDRKGTRTIIQGTQGRQVEIPIRDNVANQNIFYLDHTNSLVGRSYEHCDDLLYFSFEATPREPDRIRIALTPTVRAREKRLQYSIVPGSPDREFREVVDESHYDATIQADLPLRNIMVIAPSVEARWPTSLGANFWLSSTPSEQRERLMVIIPHAYERAE